MVARRVEQVPTPTRVEIEKDTRDNNDLLLETGLEEVEAIVNALGEVGQVEPEVESRVGHVGELEADFLETANDVVALGAEVHLQSAHFVTDTGRRKHLNGSFLEGHVATSVKVGTAGTDGLDEFLGSNNPRYTPSGETESLGKTVNDEHIVLVYILDVVGSRDDGTVAVGGVVVSAVKLVHDQSRAVPADVLDLGKFRVGDHLARWVTGV